jgi:6,7-dimethyl-8-ribityllumazine synthase
VNVVRAGPTGPAFAWQSSSRFNEVVTTALLDGAVRALAHAGVADDDVTVVWVPFRSAVARRVAGDVDAVVCLGAVIRGETATSTSSRTRPRVGSSRSPGRRGRASSVLATRTSRSAGAGGRRPRNKGWEAAMAAVEMCLLRALPRRSPDDRR